MNKQEPYRPPSTRASIIALQLLAVLLVSAAAAVTHAHRLPRTVSREIVRLQGHLAVPPSATSTARKISVVALGHEHPFFATEWQIFASSKEMGKDGLPPRIVLQGDPQLLAEFTGAKARQRITLLAERRTGGIDLFVLALDLCPPN